MKTLIQGRLIKLMLVLAVMGIVAGCAAIPKPKPDLSNPVKTVAILPFANDSNNIEASNEIRKVLRPKLMAKFYRVIPNEEVDQILVDNMGVTLGGQLSEVPFAELKQNIKADAYIYGHVLYFDQVTAGILNTNRVAAQLKMVKTDDESQFWSSNIGIKSESKSGGLAGSIASLTSAIQDGGDESIRWITIQRDTGGDGSILGNLVSGLVEKAVSNAFGVNMAQETAAFVNHSTNTLRNGPGI